MLTTLKVQVRNLNKQDYIIIKQMCRDSKDLYNTALYEIRQHYFKMNEFLDFYKRYQNQKDLPAYKKMKSDFAINLQLRIDWAFRSFIELKKKQQSGDYHCKVSLPGYLPKDGYYHLYMSPKSCHFDGKFFYFYPSKQICKELGLPSKHKIKIPFTKQINGKIKEVSLLQHNNCQYFELSIAYEHDESKTNLQLRPSNSLSIDCGLDNFATCLDCQSGRSFIMDGRKLKSINRWWNKRVAQLRSVYKKHKNSLTKKGIKSEKSSKQLIRFSRWRKHQISNYLNQMVAYIIKYCAQHNIGTIIIGDWHDIKDGYNKGRVNNQNFVQIPFSLFKQKIKHKCQIYGMTFKLQDESYTSKCSFLDQEEVCKHSTYQGKRIKRGLFKSANGTLINADVNGAGNIFIKSKRGGEVRNNLSELSSGLTLSPKRIRLPDFERGVVKMSEIVTYVASSQKQTSLEEARLALGVRH